MRKYLFLPSSFILLTVLALLLCSSCAKQSISIVKRKHSSGYYVNVSHQKSGSTAKRPQLSQSKELVKIMEEPNYSITENLSLIESNSAQHAYLASVEKQVVHHNVASNSVKSEPIKSVNKLNNKVKSSVDVKKQAKIQLKPLQQPKFKNDTNTLILVILSLFPFIALIAMYLKDNNTITLNFWVDLLLHLTIIGYAIFAILVVLDIISLA